MGYTSLMKHAGIHEPLRSRLAAWIAALLAALDCSTLCGQGDTNGEPPAGAVVVLPFLKSDGRVYFAHCQNGKGPLSWESYPVDGESAAGLAAGAPLYDELPNARTWPRLDPERWPTIACVDLAPDREGLRIRSVYWLRPTAEFAADVDALAAASAGCPLDDVLVHLGEGRFGEADAILDAALLPAATRTRIPLDDLYLTFNQDGWQLGVHDMIVRIIRGESRVAHARDEALRTWVALRCLVREADLQDQTSTVRRLTAATNLINHLGLEASRGMRTDYSRVRTADSNPVARAIVAVEDRFLAEQIRLQKSADAQSANGETEDCLRRARGTGETISVRRCFDRLDGLAEKSDPRAKDYAAAITKDRAAPKHLIQHAIDMLSTSIDEEIALQALASPQEWAPVESHDLYPSVAKWAAALVGAERASAALRQAARSPDGVARKRALRAISETLELAWADFDYARFATDPDRAVRAEVFRAAARRPGEDTDLFLRGCLRSDDATVAGDSLRVLADRERETAPRMAAFADRALVDEDDFAAPIRSNPVAVVQAGAELWLSEHGDPSEMEALFAALTDSRLKPDSSPEFEQQGLPEFQAYVVPSLFDAAAEAAERRCGRSFTLTFAREELPAYRHPPTPEDMAKIDKLNARFEELKAAVIEVLRGK